VDSTEDPTLLETLDVAADGSATALFSSSTTGRSWTVTEVSRRG
jgi:hypothetical protein